MKKGLKPEKYQYEGINKLVEWKKAMECDDMGLGKTMQSILAIEKQQSYPCLIICPASLKCNWEIEINMWTDKRAMILNDSIKTTYPLLYQSGIAHYFIVNYESLSKYFVDRMPQRKDFRLSDIDFNNNINFFKSIIVDESHRVKEPKTRQSKITAAITFKKEVVYLLTGTPVINNVLDLASQLCIIDKIKLFGGYTAFVKKYKNATIEELNELHNKLKETCIIRREKKDVAGLPKKTRQIVYVELDNYDEYKFALKDIASYLKEYKGKTDAEVRKSMRGEVMVRINLLKQISGKGKVKAVSEAIKDLNENGEKVILFGENREVLDSFKNTFKNNSVSIVGGMSADNKQLSIHKFQEDKNTLNAICSLKAAGVGITLTASRIVAFIQQGWHSAIQDQAEDRGHRKGQKREVHCLYYIAKNTIDEHIYNIIESKREMSNAITGSQNDIEWEVVEEVIELILKQEDNV
jgi:SWI/SNF-related matrix-associated actin-dependent regulator 1 of chromatin subfamily A